MMSRELLYYPDDHLKQECEAIEDPGEWKDLIEEMAPILYEHNGVGLAAPQVGVPIQLFLLRLDFEENIHEAYLNPEILDVSNRDVVDEACLSYPGVSVEIERGQQVYFRALTPSGKEIERSFDGLLAQCVQHETDHLHGRSLIDHCDLGEKMEINRVIQERLAEVDSDA